MRSLYQWLTGLILVAAGCLAAPSAKSSAAAASTAHQKTILTAESGDSFVFTPKKLTIKTNTRVTWSNPMDSVQIGHNIVSDTSSWRFTKDLAPGASVRYTFKKPGTYKYECTLHPGMKGRIVVTG